MAETAEFARQNIRETQNVMQQKQFELRRLEGDLQQLEKLGYKS